MIQVFPTAELLADAVARHIADCGTAAISARDRFTLALSGGSTPRAAYERLAARPAQLDWRRTHVFWGDERCVPPDDPRSNYGMTTEALLDRVPIPKEQIHRIRGEAEPARAAAEYEQKLGELARETPALDLVLLGLGEDGHTASLFPGQPSVHETKHRVLAVLDPEGKLWRVTLTPPVLNAARQVTFVVAGASKAARLRQVIEGAFTPSLLPAQTIRPSPGRLTWMVDEAAAGELRTDRVPT
jgi:6-phosphogluconolactonase